MHKQETARIIAEFKIRATEVSAGLEHRLLSNAEILHGVSGLFTSSTYVTRDEFQRYIKQLNLHTYNPGIQGVGYIQLIPAAQKEPHIAAVRAEGFPDYTIRPSGKRDIYSSIVFIEPLNWRNKRALGYDIQTDPVRMKAASRARDEGEAAMTGKIILQQETDKDVQAGVIIFSPIYQIGMATSTVEERRKALRGWAYAPIRIKDMLDNYLQLEYKDFSHNIAIRLYAGNTTDSANLMYDSYPSSSINALDNNDEETVISYQLLGTTWTLYIKPLPAYWLSLETEKNSGIVMGAGLILSLLFALVSSVVAWALIRNLPGLLEVLLLSRLNLRQGASYAITTILNYVIIIVGAMTVFGSLGVSWDKLQWLAAALSVGLGFGLQEIFGNFVSGLIILFERPVRIGDTVTIGTFSGTVSKIRIRATTITDFDRKEVIIPNKAFVTERLINWSLSDTVTRVVIRLGVAYGSDLDKVKEVLLKAASEHPKVMHDPAPAVFFTTFGPSTLDHELRLYVRELRDRSYTVDELNRSIDRLCRENDINIAFNQLEVHLRNEKGDEHTEVKRDIKGDDPTPA